MTILGLESMNNNTSMMHSEMKQQFQEHEQLQEQRSHLRKILEQQKREQEENDRIPILNEENYEYSDTQDNNTAKINEKVINDHLSHEEQVSSFDSAKSHDNLQNISSVKLNLEPLVPVQENEPPYHRFEQQNLHKLSAVTSHESQSEQHIDNIDTLINDNNNELFEQRYSKCTNVELSKLHATTSANGDCSTLANIFTSNTSCSTSVIYDRSESRVTEDPTTSESYILPDNVILIGPESLAQPIKSVIKYRRGKRDVPATITCNCEWDSCTEQFARMDHYISHIEIHISSLVGMACLWRNCGADFQDYSEVVRHVYFHAFHTKLKGNGQVMVDKGKMEVCKLETDSRNLVPQIPEPFVCQWEECNLSFLSAQHFYWHMDSHTHCAERVLVKGKTMLVCGWSGCNFQGDKVSRVRAHAHSHSQEKVVGCPQCGAIFSSKARFGDHLNKQKAFETLLYQCSACSRRYPNERLARDHFRNHINHWKCPRCDMTCSSQSNLEMHIKYRHSSVKPHHCQHCSKRFVMSSDLQRHMLTHTEHKMYSCHYPDCQAKFKTFSTLDKHIKKTHLLSKDVYSCHVCPTECSTGAALSRHLTGLHNLTWPSGHSRFIYRRDSDGRYRLQTVRYESLEMVQGVDNNLQEADANLQKVDDNPQDAEGNLQEVDNNLQEVDENLQGTDGNLDGVDNNLPEEVDANFQPVYEHQTHTVNVVDTNAIPPVDGGIINSAGEEHLYGSHFTGYSVEMIPPNMDDGAPPTSVTAPPTSVAAPSTSVVRPPTSVGGPPTSIHTPPTSICDSTHVRVRQRKPRKETAASAKTSTQLIPVYKENTNNTNLKDVNSHNKRKSRRKRIQPKSEKELVVPPSKKQRRKSTKQAK